MSRAKAVPLKPSFRARWSAVDAVVVRGTAGLATKKKRMTAGEADTSKENLENCTHQLMTYDGKNYKIHERF